MVSTKEEGMYENSEHIVKLNYNDFIKKNNKVILKNKKKFQKYKGKIGLLKVYAEWCGHCHSVKEVIEEISQILQKDKITIFVIDFANIQTPEDIASFNQQYDVNLTLPQGA